MSQSRTHLSRDIGIDFFNQRTRQAIGRLTFAELLKSIYLKYCQVAKLNVRKIENKAASQDKTVGELITGSFYELITHPKVSFNFLKSLEFFLFVLRAFAFKASVFCTFSLGVFEIPYCLLSLAYLSMQALLSPYDTGYAIYKEFKQAKGWADYFFATLKLGYSLATWVGVGLLGYFFAPAIAAFFIGFKVVAAAIASVVLTGIVCKLYRCSSDKPSFVQPISSPKNEDRVEAQKKDEVQSSHQKINARIKVNAPEVKKASISSISSLGLSQEYSDELQSVSSSSSGLFVKASLSKPQPHQPQKQNVIFTCRI